MREMAMGWSNNVVADDGMVADRKDINVFVV